MTNLTAQTQHPGETGDMASPADKGRRKFLVAAGWSLMGASMAGTAFAAYKYLFPPVLYEPPTVFKIGHVSIYGLGVDEIKETAQSILSLKDCDTITETSQIVGSSKTGRPASDNGNLRSGRLPVRDAGSRRIAQG